MSQSSDTEFFSSLADQGWFADQEGQLSVDVVETPRHVLIRSAIAGISADDLDISVTHDTVTIRGKRHHGFEQKTDHVVHVQECYWGAFSRSVVLPCHIRPEGADATLKNGILTVLLEKVEQKSKVPVIDLD
jgi:HSP20 family protein